MRNLGAEIHIRIILTASFDAEAPKVFLAQRPLFCPWRKPPAKP